uniref:DNA ligase 4 isoform X2 n=1 Tax=Ciona intestinalis TaxID=7719 RepID=UPI000EF4C334|nr:DNA ligase 4 isoform X2 [Ciona intestinalis]|eukprot:XP_026689652.1 DNA ligase 4 isoform X2 [Ciona intestinalis]
MEFNIEKQSTSTQVGKDNEGKSVASKIPFHQLCILFDKIYKAKSNAVRRQELKLFISKWRELQTKFHQPGKIDTLYPAIRLILPQLDKERVSYGLKEVLLARLYVDVMGLSRTGKDAKKLLEFRNPKVNSSNAGDFAETAYKQLLSKRCIDKGSLKISEINLYLDKIAVQSSEKKKEMVRKTFLELIQKTSGVEQKWMIRIILKDMKLRMGQKVILEEIHPDAEEVFNVTSSLKQVCERLNDPDVRLADTEIQLFQPFRPMLALNANITEVEKLLGNQPFKIEIKYDGERSQLHKEGNRYKYFSRSGREYSTVFGETPYTGTLTPFIYGCFHESVSSCILDGEMMGFDPQLNIFMQKGGKFDIKHITEDSELQPCFVVFDILLLNQERLTSKPQSERFKLFNKLIQPLEGRMHLTEAKEASSNQEVMSSLNDAIDRREEGIIVKNPNAKYFPNKRKGSGWFKIKPEYVGGVVDDLDLVIIGATFGTGRHGNMLSMFHLGVGVRDSEDSSDPPRVFKSLCRIGSGYTDKQLLQVRATEIISSSSYAAHCTLRFPRLIAIREDKTYLDALDTSQLDNLRSIADDKKKVKKRIFISSPSMSSLPPLDETRDLQEKMDELKTLQNILDRQVSKLQGYFDILMGIEDGEYTKPKNKTDDLNNNSSSTEDLYKLTDKLKTLLLNGADLKGDAITFRATSNGVLSTISQCLQLVNNRELLWQTRLKTIHEKKFSTDHQRIESESSVESGDEEDDIFFDPEGEVVEQKVTHEHSEALNQRIKEHLALLDHSDPDANGWEQITEDGEMKVYRKELVQDGLICDPLKAVHSVGLVTAKEMCHYFWFPDVRRDWEETVDVFDVLETLDEATTINYQTHKQVWPAAQRDCLYLSSMVKVDNPPSVGDKIPHDTWIVCNFSVDHPEANPVSGCVRALIEVALICQTFITLPKDGGPITRDCLQCDIIYVANVNPGGWAPASVLRSIYKREYPKFLNRFTNYVQQKTKDLKLLF